MTTPMTQIMMMIRAILFAMALALTVALICLSYVHEGSADELPSEPEPATTTTDPYVYPPLDTLPPGSETDSESITTLIVDPTLPPVEELGNGLAYASNGNGTCTLTGIGLCTDVCIVIPEYAPTGDRVTAIANGAFYGCYFVTAIQIPSSVTYIGTLAFAACENLMYISVNTSNPAYCDIDGILYTSDGTTLLLYPPMRAGSSVTISSVTQSIDEMAFYNCAYLTHVYYTGSAEQWESIRIGAKNYSLTAASKSFSALGK